jgi:hypothetical protein
MAITGGRKSRARSKARRQAERKALKMSRQAQYETWRDAGQNQKSVRARRQAKRHRLVNPFDHPNGPCGNPACKKCSRPLTGSAVQQV